MKALKSLLSPSARSALGALALLLLIIALYLTTGDIKRGLQLSVFSIPFIAFALAAPACGRTLCALFRVVAVAGFALLTVDAGVRAFLKQVYTAEPLSSFVLEAIANTSVSESTDFLVSQWPDVLLWCAVSAVAFALEVLIILKLHADAVIGSRAGRIVWRSLALLFTAVFVLSVCKSSWRGHYPPWFWPKWANEIAVLEATWANAALEREKELETARSHITEASAEPRTIVLVLGESTCRDNWSLYGYERDTTPKLTALEKEDPNFVTVRKAWSVDSATVGAFCSMLTFPVDPEGIAKRHANEPAEGMQAGNALAFFAAAGWSIHWISNQDDRAISSRFAEWSEKPTFLNRMSGRTSVSMDEKVLPAFKEALQDPASRKIIVVHLIGAHPHYSLRYPDRLAPDWGEDAVEKKLSGLDRSPWVIISRNQYDAAMRYQDEVIYELLDVSRRAVEKYSAPLSWIYLSDHGQELGDEIDRAGHSPLTEDGYRIPFLLWSSENARFAPFESRPFRADQLSPLLLSIAGIHWKGESEKENFLSDLYDWRKPKLTISDEEMPPSESQ
ncbi:phosphoethanolamine transferase [Sutterella sp.]|uniref:phosphoethanolamine transferase n=1 Tax=Sutterella sp. TaxID=1981025 RepID=UPI0026DF339F|nr:phosphoethanolamine transferase [Sutterella sp.]MDO5532518.1 phosphoethanolamine transferase [Sutterella sp.]